MTFFLSLKITGIYIKKTLYLIFGWIILSVLTSSCSKTKLQTEIDELNKKLPEHIADGIELTKVTYENEEVNIFFSTSSSPKIKAVKADNELAKEYLMQQLASNDIDLIEIFNLVGKEKTCLNVVCKDIISNNQAKIIYSAEEVSKSKYNKSIDPITALKFDILASNQILPCQVDEITTLYKIYLEGDYVVYDEHVDDRYLDFGEIQSSTYLKQEIKKALKDRINVLSKEFGFAELSIKANKGLKYRYIGEYSGIVFDIIFTVPEIKSMLNY